jgi:hypothetical protein
MHWAANNGANKTVRAAFFRSKVYIGPFAWMDGLTENSHIRDIQAVRGVFTRQPQTDLFTLFEMNGIGRWVATFILPKTDCYTLALIFKNTLVDKYSHCRTYKNEYDQDVGKSFQFFHGYLQLMIFVYAT